MLGMIKDENQDEKYIEMIQNYFFLDKRIAQVEEKIESLKWGFSHRNYYGGMTYDSPHGVRYVAFKVDNEVVRYADALNSREQSVVMLKRKQYHFKRYLSTLTLDAQRGLKRDFKRIDEGMYKMTLTNTHRELIMEILEIEEAISHEFKRELLPEHVKDMVVVETNNLTPDTLEESFDTMLEMLGVKKSVTS